MGPLEQSSLSRNIYTLSCLYKPRYEIIKSGCLFSCRREIAARTYNPFQLTASVIQPRPLVRDNDVTAEVLRCDLAIRKLSPDN